MEIGCGNGDMSVFLAKHGGRVFAIDNTYGGIHNTLALAEANNVNLRAEVMDAGDIDKIDVRFDFVVGKFILHHIEPFNEFARKIRACLNDGGIGIFYENSSRNKILMFFRTYVVGRWGIPKYGDTVEIPFEDKEIEMLRNEFGQITVSIPKFVFFSMLGTYVFRKSNSAKKFFNGLDEFFYKYIPVFNRYSYHQIISFEK